MKINLRQAKKQDINTLKNLWQICFGDRMRYINVFFERMFEAENTVIAEEQGKVAGVVYILKRTYSDKPFLYGYGIGVFPEYRGNGICEKMLAAIKNYCKENDILFGLHPANDKLSKFYKRIGLNEMYYLKIADCSKYYSENEYEIADITADEFYELRSTAFNNSVDWDRKTIEYILENGEIVKKVTLNGKRYYFVISVDNNKVIVKETNADDAVIKEVSDIIKRFFDAEKIIFILSSKSTLQGEIKPMIYGFSQENKDVYMNLFLD